MKPLKSRWAAANLCQSIDANALLALFLNASVFTFCKLHKFCCLVAEFYCPPLGHHWPIVEAIPGQHWPSIRLHRHSQCKVLYTWCLCWWWWGLIWWGSHLGAGQNVVTFWCWPMVAVPWWTLAKAMQSRKIQKAAQCNTTPNGRRAPSAGQQQQRPQWQHYSDAAVHCRPLFAHSGVLLDGPLSLWKIVFLSGDCRSETIYTELLLLFINWMPCIKSSSNFYHFNLLNKLWQSACRKTSFKTFFCCLKILRKNWEVCHFAAISLRFLKL